MYMQKGAPVRGRPFYWTLVRGTVSYLYEFYLCESCLFTGKCSSPSLSPS